MSEKGGASKLYGGKFANLDDARTLSQAENVQERNMLLGDMVGGQHGGPIGESNETKMTENEAFLAYC